jgi:uncharacterized membrane protein YedE/YeeE
VSTVTATPEETAGRAPTLAAGVAGVVFGLGLVVSGMTRQEKVLNVLDVVSGAWDPSLAFVMVGAIGVHALLRLAIARSQLRPVFSATFIEPKKAPVDARLLLGAAIFGVGWGLTGVCPGPALVATTSLAPSLVLFAVGLAAGFGLFAVTVGRARPSS